MLHRTQRSEILITFQTYATLSTTNFPICPPTILLREFHRLGQLAASVKDQPSFATIEPGNYFPENSCPGRVCPAIAFFSTSSRSISRTLAGLLSLRRVHRIQHVRPNFFSPRNLHIFFTFEC